MKKILLAAVVLALGTSALSAKTNTPWFLGGGVSSAAEKYADDKEGRFSVSPQVGYMFNDNWGIALDVTYGLDKDNGKEDTAMGVGLSGLYNLKITDKFFYTPSLRVGFASETNKEHKEKVYEGTVIGAELDFLKFELRPSCHWGFTFAFGTLDVSSAKVKDDDDSTLRGGLNLGRTAVGFKYYF